MNRAEKAKATLDSDFIKDAFKDISEECYKVIRTSSHDQVELREDMYYLLRAKDVFEEILKKHIRDGKIDQINKIAVKRIMR